MSPEAKAGDLVYHQLKADVMTGLHPPSSILNVHQIATELGVSVTPVRDAMERLVGERLVAPKAGGGFHVPCLDVGALCDLYTWHGHLARGAVSSKKAIRLPGRITEASLGSRWSNNEAVVEDTAIYFLAVANASESAEYHQALRSAGERLYTARLHEWRVIKAQDTELFRLIKLATPGYESQLRNAISAYHHRRVRTASSLVQRIRNSGSE